MEKFTLFSSTLGVSTLSSSEELQKLWNVYLTKSSQIPIRPLVYSDTLEENNNDYFTENQQLLDLFIFLNLKETLSLIISNYLNEMSFEFKDINIKSSWGCLLKNNTKTRNFHSQSDEIPILKGIYSIDGEATINFFPKKSSSYSFSSLNKNSLIKKEFNLDILPGSLLLFPGELDYEITRKNNKSNYIAFNSDL